MGAYRFLNPLFLVFRGIGGGLLEVLQDGVAVIPDGRPGFLRLLGYQLHQILAVLRRHPAQPHYQRSLIGRSSVRVERSTRHQRVITRTWG